MTWNSVRLPYFSSAQCLAVLCSWSFHTNAYMHLQYISSHYNPIDVFTILRTNGLHFFGLKLFISITMWYFFICLPVFATAMAVAIADDVATTVVLFFNFQWMSRALCFSTHGLFPCSVLHTFCSGDCYYFQVRRKIGRKRQRKK